MHEIELNKDIIRKHLGRFAKLLKEARVKSHIRRSKSGKVTTVQDFDRKDKMKVAAGMAGKRGGDSILRRDSAEWSKGSDDETVLAKIHKRARKRAAKKAVRGRFLKAGLPKEKFY